MVLTDLILVMTFQSFYKHLNVNCMKPVPVNFQLIFQTFCILFLGGFSLITNAADRLSRIEEDLIEQSSISHLTHGIVVSAMENSDNLVLFDVREIDEYEVSHLDKAIRVDPDISGEEFLQRYGEELTGKQVIFYCSTGRRSTSLAERVKTVIDTQHSPLPAPSNMRGGIFRWHNSSQPLINQSGDTAYVHPYNWWWKRLVTRKDFTSYNPVE
jgi:rhodanese-related sulfurtransferase